MKLLPILLLLSLSASAQDKPATVGGETNHVRVFAWKFWHGNDRNVATIPDTIPALITAHHKIRPKSVTFYGYVVRNGKRSEYFDECWNRMPDRWVMTKYETR